MSYFLGFLLRRGIDSLHLSALTTLILLVGLLITFALFRRAKKVKKLQHLLYGIALTLAAASLLTSFFLPAQLQSLSTYSPAWLRPAVALPIAFMIGLVALLIGLVRSKSRYLMHAVAFSLVGLFTSGSLLYQSFTSPLSNFASSIQTASASTALLNSTAISYGKPSDPMPTQSLAQSVLSAAIKKNFGSATISYDNQGSFYINGDKATLTKPTATTAAFIKGGHLNGLGQLSGSTAVLIHAMHAVRDTYTSTWKPAGYAQMKLTAPKYGNYLYNRGHSIGDVLVAGWSSVSADQNPAQYTNASLSNPHFAATAYNPYNVTCQTSWANQADGGQFGTVGYGQNYFEGLVRADETNNASVKIAYSVTPLYDGANKVPSGNWIQALSSDGKVNINVFIPNVQPGVAINYATGVGTVK